MKTAMIFNEFEDIKYFVLDGNHRQYQGIYINTTDSNPMLQDLLVKLMYDDEGRHKNTPVEITEFASAIREGAVVVECGMIP